MRRKVIFAILTNWEELKAYFLCTENTQTLNSDQRYRARAIKDMLHDPTNFLYFTFVGPVVSEFEQVNAFFQETSADQELMVKELDQYLTSLKARVYDSTGIPQSLTDVDFGSKFILEVNKYLEFFKNSGATQQIEDLQTRCATMLLEAMAQVEKQLPRITNIFKNLSSLQPRRVLSQTDRMPFSDLPLKHLLQDNSLTLEQQYRKLLHQNWAKESVFGGEIPEDTVAFWIGIAKYRNMLGHHPFKDLALYALSCLSSPVSNAVVVERIFSHMTSIKTKHRHRMETHMLQSIIRIKTQLHFQGKCCQGMKVTPKMLDLFCSNMYCDAKEAEEPKKKVIL